MVDGGVTMAENVRYGTVDVCQYLVSKPLMSVASLSMTRSDGVPHYREIWLMQCSAVQYDVA